MVRLPALEAGLLQIRLLPPRHIIEIWCNGSTRPFEGRSLGSVPSISTPPIAQLVRAPDCESGDTGSIPVRLSWLRSLTE